jgi:hypothetical protein
MMVVGFFAWGILIAALAQLQLQQVDELLVA